MTAQIIHASAVAFDGRAALILGASGAGKSTLALQLLALGAVLVGDDRVKIVPEGDQLFAEPAPNIAGMIEARGVGLLAAPVCARAAVQLVIDLDQEEPERLPPLRKHHNFGMPLDLVHGKGNLALAPAIWLLLQGARVG